MYLEQPGATCVNCGNVGKVNCTQKCIDKDYANREPAEGVKVRLYGIYHGKRRGMGREGAKEAG